MNRMSKAHAAATMWVRVLRVICACVLAAVALDVCLSGPAQGVLDRRRESYLGTVAAMGSYRRFEQAMVGKGYELHPQACAAERRALRLRLDPSRREAVLGGVRERSVSGLVTLGRAYRLLGEEAALADAGSSLSDCAFEQQNQRQWRVYARSVNR